MPGGYGGDERGAAAVRRAAIAAKKAAGDAAFANVLANAAKGRGNGHAGESIGQQWTSGSKAKGKSWHLNRGGGKAGGPPTHGLNWECLACGERNNYPHRESCYRCRARRSGKGAGKGGGKGKGQPKAAGKGLADPPPQSLRPNYGRRDDGPIGADGKRPRLLVGKFIEDQARERAAAATANGKDGRDSTDKEDSDGFTVVARAAGVWPRVGGANHGGGKPAVVAAAAAQPVGGKTMGASDSACLRGKGGNSQSTPSTSATTTKGGGAKGGVVPARPPWADQDDADLGDDWSDDGSYDDAPEDKHEQADDEVMDNFDDGDWVNDECYDYDFDADDAELEQEPETEVLRQRWQNKKDVFQAVAARYWKGQAQDDDAKA